MRNVDNDLHGWPRVLEACGIGLLLAGCGLSFGALFGAAPAAGLRYGPVMMIAGLVTRTGANAWAAWQIEDRGGEGPKQARGGRPLSTELDAVREFEMDQAGSGTRFVAMLERRRQTESEQAGIGQRH
jgi:hypothetical protein